MYAEIVIYRHMFHVEPLLIALILVDEAETLPHHHTSTVPHVPRGTCALCNNRAEGVQARTVPEQYLGGKPVSCRYIGGLPPEIRKIPDPYGSRRYSQRKNRDPASQTNRQTDKRTLLPDHANVQPVPRGTPLRLAT